jgi:glycosyltransferase involved in cell wall biosynthesis
MTSRRRHASAGVKGVVGISQFVLDRHLEDGCFSGTPVQAVIPNGYSTSMHVTRNEGGQAERRSAIVFGYLGRLRPNKGVEVLLETLKGFRHPGWQLVVAGTGAPEYEARLRSRHATERINFAGFQTPDAFFPSVDYLIVPSLWHEPLGRVVIEAFAHGVPVIGADRGGISELIEPRKTGFLYDPDRPSELWAILTELIEEGPGAACASEMAVACRQEALNYDPLLVANSYANLYRKVLTATVETGVGRGM